MGRMALLSLPDERSDDVYLYSATTRENNRVSKSSFGTPVGYLSDTRTPPSIPSNRFPVISGNGRYVFFSSDSKGKEGLVFLGSNQLPADINSVRDIYYRDLKTQSVSEQVATVKVLYPTNDLEHSFAPRSPVPVVAQVEYSGVINRVDIILNQETYGSMSEFGGGGFFNSFKSSRFTHK